MRDLIWTIIVIWLVWKIIAAFKSNTKHKTANSNFDDRRREGEIKIEDYNKNSHQSKFNSDNAEFVDYEEIK